jgi:hypothetical protein
MGVDHHDSILPFKRGIGWTNSDTTWVVTVIAEDWKKGLPHIRIVSLFYLFDPGGPYTQRNLVLHLTGDFTGVTTNTPPKIDHHAIFDLPHSFPLG